MGVWSMLAGPLAGAVLGISLLKFGNPVIFEGMIVAPEGVMEFLLQPWPVSWGYLMVGVVALLVLKSGRFEWKTPRWLLLLPLVWLAWQFVSSTRSVSPELSRATLWHFSATVTWFYVGVFGLARFPNLRFFWGLLLSGFLLVLWFGSEQHYGGLEATRRMIYEQPNWRDFPPAYLKKIASDRIFSTLVYPNALAGVILLLFPFLLPVAWRVAAPLPRIARMVCVGLMAYLAVACLYWSGSKAGWLIALAVGALALSSRPFPRRVKVIALSVVLLGGLTVFAVRYAPYFKRGATSVGARFDYWEAAARTALDRPFFGSGPGTFSVPYAKIKRPESEMARLVHNDYLEQASDSGVIGFATYTTFVLALMAGSARKVWRHPDRSLFAVWLGLAGWTLQGLVEFSLYIPALAWPAFALMGYLFARCQDQAGPGETIRQA